MAALLIAAPAAAQTGLAPSSPTGSGSNFFAQFNLRGTVGIPQGELQQNIDGPGGGIHAYAAGGAADLPLLFGLDVGIINYGRTSTEVPFSETVGPAVPVEVSTRNNVLETHVFLRLQPRAGRLRPYVEGLVGFKYLFTRTSVEEDDVENSNLGDDIAGSTNYDSFAFSGGGGIGLDIRVFQKKTPGSKRTTVSVHLGLQYLLGTEAEYLAEGRLVDENGNNRLDRDELDVRRSRTTFLQPQLGATLRFGGGRE